MSPGDYTFLWRHWLCEVGLPRQVRMLTFQEVPGSDYSLLRCYLNQNTATLPLFHVRVLQ